MSTTRGIWLWSLGTFVLLLLASTAASAAEPIDVLWVGNGNYANETRFINHMTAMGGTADAYDIYVTKIKDYNVKSTTDLSGYDLVVLTGFAPNVSTAGLQRIEDSGLPILVISYWDSEYAERLGLADPYGPGYVGAKNVEMFTTDHPVTALFNATEQIYSTSYTIYGVDADDLDENVTPLIYSSRSFNEIGVYSDDERRIFVTGIYDASRYTAKGWEIFDSIVEQMLPLERVFPEPASIFRSLASNGILNFIEEVSAHPWLWNTATAESNLNSIIRASGTPAIANHAHALLARIFHDNELLSFSYSPDTCVVPPGAGTGRCFSSNNPCVSASTCPQVATGILSSTCKLVPPGEAGCTVLPGGGYSQECYATCIPTRGTCATWQASILNSVDNVINVPTYVGYDSTQFGSFPFFGVLGVEESDILSTGNDNPSNTRMAISLLSTEPFYFSRVFEGTINVVNNPQDCEEGSVCLLGAHSISATITIPSPFPWFGIGSSPLLDKSDFPLKTIGENVDVNTYYWRGTAGNMFSPDSVDRTVYNPFMTRFYLNAYEYNATLSPGYQVSVTGTSGKHVVVFDFFKFAPGKPHERGNPEFQQCSYRSLIHPYATSPEDSLNNYASSFIAQEPPIACRPGPTCPYPIELNSEQDQCRLPDEFQDPFNPFSVGGLPNTFGDAVGGTTSSFDDPSSHYGMLPRMQLVWPSNPWLSRFNIIETFCNDNTSVCANLPSVCDEDAGSPTPEQAANLQLFKNFFGFSSGSFALGNDQFCQYFDPDLITARQRTDIAWSAEDDIGPWQVPRLTAGFWVPVVINIRQDDSSLPAFFDSAYCTSDATDEGATIGLFSKDGTILAAADMMCGPLRSEFSGNESLLQSVYDWNEAIPTETGITFMTRQFIEGEESSLLQVPISYSGPAELVFHGPVKLRQEDGEEIEYHVERHFPVYIDGADEKVQLPTVAHTVLNPGIGTPFTDLSTVRDSLPLSWIGSSYSDGLNSNTSLKLSFDQTVSWTQTLSGGDEGPWLWRRKGAIESKLFSLFGDVDSNISTSAFSLHYSGAGLASFIDLNEYPTPEDWEDDTDTDLPVAVKYPLMSIERDQRAWENAEYTNVPNTYIWDILPKGGARVLRGYSAYQDYEEYFSPSTNSYWNLPVIDQVSYCSSSSEATVAPTSAFQFPSQYPSGDSYVWFGVATDWGTSNAPGMGGSGNGKDPLTGFALAAINYNYNYQMERPWNAKLGRWKYQDGIIDDFGASVSWPYLRDENGQPVVTDGVPETTRFVIVATYVTSDLSQHVENAPGGVALEGTSGLLIWHTGRYRNSPVYFSWVKEADLLYPERYWHYAGLSGPETPIWSQVEADSKPVVFDTVGELSAVVIPHNASAACDPVVEDCVFEQYKLLYNLNSAGQQGIVLRDAEKPWGPFGKHIPLFDCTHTAFDGKAIGRKVQFWDWQEDLPESNKRRFLSGLYTCYGGFTHDMLWTRTSEQNTIRFNVSAGFNPYKVFLAETKVSK